MIGLDTNILLRAFTQDDPRLSKTAAEVLNGLTEERPGVINLVVLAELAWTLRTAYGYSRIEIVELIEKIIDAAAYFVAERIAVNAALTRCRREGLHFADALICELNLAAGCPSTLTFDRKASSASGFTLAS